MGSGGYVKQELLSKNVEQNIKKIIRMVNRAESNRVENKA